VPTTAAQVDVLGVDKLRPRVLTRSGDGHGVDCRAMCDDAPKVRVVTVTERRDDRVSLRRPGRAWDLVAC
jgi:hypothetical protein